MKRIGLFVLGMLMCGNAFAALTVAQRTSAQQVANQISNKAQEISQWASFRENVEKQGWKVSAQLPYSAGTIDKTYTEQEQTDVDKKYDTLKVELQALVNQLP